MLSSNLQMSGFSVQVSVRDARGMSEPVVLDKSRITIGRELRCDIRAHEIDARASRFHAEIRIKADRVVFSDHHSRNGTFLDGQRIETVILEPGREYHFFLGDNAGPTVVIVKVLAGLVPRPAAARTMVDRSRPRPMAVAPPAMARPPVPPAMVRRPVPPAMARRPVPPAAHRSDEPVTSVTPIPRVVERAPEPQGIARSTSRVMWPERRVYRVAQVLHGVRSRDDVYQRQFAGELAQLAQEILEEEAPISVRLLARRVAPYWGISRASGKLRNEILASLSQHGPSTKQPIERAGFLWRSGEPPGSLKHFRVPTSDERSVRPAEDLPVEEIVNAAIYTLSREGLLTAELLARKTAQLFALSRLGSNVKRKLDATIALLARDPRVHQPLNGLWTLTTR